MRQQQRGIGRTLMALSFRAWILAACSVLAVVVIATPLWWYIDLQNSARYDGPVELKHMLEIKLDPTEPAELFRRAQALAAAPGAESITDLLLTLDSSALQRIDFSTVDSLVRLTHSLRGLLPNARLLMQFPQSDTSNDQWPNAHACRQILLRADFDGAVVDLRVHGYEKALSGTALQILNDMRYDRRIDGLRLAGTACVGLASRVYGSLASGKTVNRTAAMLRREAPNYVILDAGDGLLPQWFVDRQQIEQCGLIHKHAPTSSVFLAREAAGRPADEVYAEDLLRTMLGKAEPSRHCDLGLCSAPPADAPATPTFGLAFQLDGGQGKRFTGLREESGALLLMGGGRLDAGGMMDTLVRRMGGPDAPIVIIPTAMAGERFNESWPNIKALNVRGVHNITVLHTRDASTADSAAFCEPLRHARAVLFLGGRQWRLIEAFQHTRLIDELRGVLRRGGIVAGTSAGASALASFLVRGEPGDNRIVIGKYHEGFGLLENVAIDQHLLARRRERDLVGVVRSYPELLGIGIDEHTGILVESERFTVVGISRVAVYDNENWCRWPRRYKLLLPGQVFDMSRRCLIPEAPPTKMPSHTSESAPPVAATGRETLNERAGLFQAHRRNAGGTLHAARNTKSANPSL